MSDTDLVLRRTEAVRRFSRFYTKQIGVLQEGLLRSPFSLAEARVLYEVAHHGRTTATELAAELGLDTGYMSRILRALQKRGLIAKTTSETDARRKLLRLTPAGRKAFAALDAASRTEVGAMLASLTEDEQADLVRAMGRVEDLLGDGPERSPSYVLRPHHTGDLGWIVYRHGVLYAREYGWDERFEAMVAAIVADFVERHDPRRERCWIAEIHGENVGSIACVRKSATVAKLRLLLVEPKARGRGIGRRLVDECIRFARRAGYRKLTLFTDGVLVAARRIYEDTGFVLVDEAPHDLFGRDQVGQTWELTL